MDGCSLLVCGRPSRELTGRDPFFAQLACRCQLCLNRSISSSCNPQARRIQRKAQEQASSEAAEPDHPERKSLGLLGGRSRGGAGLGGKRKAAVVDAENVSAAANGGGGGLAVFEDDEFGAVGGAPAASAPPAFLQPARCGGRAVVTECLAALGQAVLQLHVLIVAASCQLWHMSVLPKLCGDGISIWSIVQVCRRRSVLGQARRL
jgi:hypothetical protein